MTFIVESSISSIHNRVSSIQHQITRYKIKPDDKEIIRLSFIGKGNASIKVTRIAITSDNHPISGTYIYIIIKQIIKKVTEPAKDLSKNLTESVILPTIAAKESAIVNIITAGTAISFLNMINVTVAEINK